MLLARGRVHGAINGLQGAAPASGNPAAGLGHRSSGHLVAGSGAKFVQRACRLSAPNPTPACHCHGQEPQGKGRNSLHPRLGQCMGYRTRLPQRRHYLPCRNKGAKSKDRGGVWAGGYPHQRCGRAYSAGTRIAAVYTRGSVWWDRRGSSVHHEGGKLMSAFDPKRTLSIGPATEVLRRAGSRRFQDQVGCPRGLIPHREMAAVIEPCQA